MLKSVGAKVDLVDASGRVVASQTFEVHQDYQARLRPGDMAGYGVLIYEDSYAADYARPVEAVMTLIAAETDGAAASYPPATPVSVVWRTEVPPGVQVEVAARQQGYTENSIMKQHHFRGVYEVRLAPGSAPAELLKLQMEFLDGAGTVVETSEVYAVSGQEPSLQGGESRVVQMLTFLSQVPAGGERLTVIEAR